MQALKEEMLPGYKEEKTRKVEADRAKKEVTATTRSVEHRPPSCDLELSNTASMRLPSLYFISGLPVADAPRTLTTPPPSIYC